MDDLISREQAIDALREKLAEYVPYLYSRKVEEIPLECEMTIRNLPQKTGKWIHDGKDFPHGNDWIHCSVCGKRGINVPADLTNYCPSCGSRMENES